MNIALVHTALWGRGGAERQLLNLAIELQKLGNYVEIFTTGVNDACYPELQKQVNINVMRHNRFIPIVKSSSYEVGAITGYRNRIHKILARQFYMIGLPAMLKLGKLIPKGFDIINNHNQPTQWAIFSSKKRLKTPVVWMCNEPPSWYYIKGRGIRRLFYYPLFRIYDQLSVKYIDRIVVLSHVAENMVKDAYDLPSTTVRTGLNIEKFRDVSGENIRKKHGLEHDFLLLQVGNLSFNRQSDSIKALHYLPKNHSNRNVKLILDGAGSTKELKAYAEKLGLQDKVLFWHTESDKELVQVYASCDVFIFPQQVTWGLAVIEAMASSKPVIVYKGCGASEIIQDGTNGFVVDNSVEMANRISYLMENPDVCLKIGERSRDFVTENISWTKYALEMNQIFKDTLTLDGRLIK